ncbi:MAG: 2-oxoacid:acceptor oxidoreductase subunit alpha [Spirochaetia bacterium]|nr:2-oxoacid:acceptor oxidoreductase subunit alpha [Spirochaetia bacterium]
MNKNLIIGMAGAGGDGVVSAGDSLITALAIDGYHALLTKSFGPQIRGGESSMKIRVSTSPVRSIGEYLDVAIALNWEDFLKFGAELPITEKTIVIYDSNTGIAPENIPVKGKPFKVLSIPIEEMAVNTAKTNRAKNTVVLGLISGWFGIAEDGIITGIRNKFTKKGPEVLKGNEDAFYEGVKYAKENPISDKDITISKPPAGAKGKLLTDGNDICAAAAIFSGCEFFGGYPITPSSEIMQLLNREIWKYGGSMIQMEDEIAGVASVIGASFAGKKALTATSGPGMSLKSEIFGLATMAELPMVIVNVQRGGPSTGIPTKSEQADLFQAAFSAHGDVVRPILAPVDVHDMFSTTVEAFNIAEYYQTPVIILSDQELSQRKEVIDEIDVSAFKIINRQLPTEAEMENYERFKFTENHISPVSHPGMLHGNYLAAGIEHSESGAPTSSGELHAKMIEKRTRKLDPLKKRSDLFSTFGPSDAELCMISWGTVAGVAMEARDLAEAEGIKVKLLVPKLLFPVAESVYMDYFKSVKKGLVIEQNVLGQLYHIIRMFVNVPDGLKSFAKAGSNPFGEHEILKKIKEL